MKSPRRFAPLLAAFLSLAAASAFAASYPEPKQGDWVARDFRFHTGEPVLVLHGTAGSGAGMLTEARVLAINSSDDERNPPELGVMERELKRVKDARYYLIPGGPDTRGHGTTGLAKLYKSRLEELLRDAPKR